MPWTGPKTWVPSEVLTAPDFNVQFRDNLLYLFDAAPIGAMLFWGDLVVPNSLWQFCDGGAISRTTYAALWAKWGVRFGPGDSSTTFNKPDARGRVLIGVDGAAERVTSASTGGASADTLGGTGGAETHLLTGPQSGIGEHTHANPDGKGNYILNSAGLFYQGAGSGNITFHDSSGITGRVAGGPQNAQQGHSNTQPWLALHLIAKVL